MTDSRTAPSTEPHPGVISILSGKCPRCGMSSIFKSPNPYNLKMMTVMETECPHCHLRINPEIGFYWGATYVAYALTVAFSAFTFVISTLLFGFINSLSLTYFAVNTTLLIITSPLTLRYSRILWLWMFYEK